jgi:superoxide reductase
VEFADIVKSKNDEGKEKHVPIIEINKSSGGTDVVTVIVGKEVAHPNTIEHHIAYLQVYGHKVDGQVVLLAKADFGPSYTSPKITFEISLAEIETVYAVSYCNIHGLWKNSIKA